MIAYRISKKAYIKDLSGFGAGMYGGRWNPIGIKMVYTSGSIALATLEYLVHNFHLLSTAEICLAKIEIGNPFPISEIENSDLPSGWNKQMQQHIYTQRKGREFILNSNDYILSVPSAVVPGEYNLLLNPHHQNHKQTKITKVIDPFVFDQRILDLA